MKTVPFSAIRENFTEVADKVRFTKEFCILTKNNKPALGLVSPEMLGFLVEVLKMSHKNKDLVKLVDEHSLYLNKADFKYVEDQLKDPRKISTNLKNAFKAAKDKFEDV